LRKDPLDPIDNGTKVGPAWLTDHGDARQLAHDGIAVGASLLLGRPSSLFLCTMLFTVAAQVLMLFKRMTDPEIQRREEEAKRKKEEAEKKAKEAGGANRSGMKAGAWGGLPGRR
jgi:hypothetical protein